MFLDIWNRCNINIVNYMLLYILFVEKPKTIQFKMYRYYYLSQYIVNLYNIFSGGTEVVEQ